MVIPKQIPKKQTLSTVAAERIRVRILDGTLRPGEHLKQEVLANQLGISRTPMRDAFRTLERDGLVSVDEVGMAIVVKFSAVDAKDIIEIRATVDGIMAARAARLPYAERRKSGKRLFGIVRKLKKAAEANDIPKFRITDSAFHEAIVSVCNSEQLARCQALVHGSALSLYSVRTPDEGHLLTAYREHERIASAIVSGNSVISQQLAIQHVWNAYNYYYSAKEEGTPLD